MFAKSRIKVAEADIAFEGKVSKFFDILDNSGGLTEEFLYEHQPVTDEVVVVYSTSPNPVGRLDLAVAKLHNKTILNGPLIIIARKGYAGRTFVAHNPLIVVHEDAYAISPKKDYAGKISLDWFAGHYSEEFQSFKTANEGIGDFPRMMLNSRNIVIPKLETQERLARLYRRRDELVREIDNLGNVAMGRIDSL